MKRLYITCMVGIALVGIALVHLSPETRDVDYGRAVVIALGSALFALSARVTVVQWLRARRAEKRVILPTHIWAMALSYLGLVVGVTGAVIEAAGGPVRWFALPVALIFFPIGCYGLLKLVVLQDERKRRP